jgi:TolB-like protein
MNRPTAPTRVLPAAQTPSSTRALSEPKRRRLVIALIAVVLVIFAVVGYFYSRKNDNAANVAIGSIAVLPFVNQNNDPNTEYLSDGIPESIISSLSQLPNLKVMSRNSVFHYKGKDMDAQAIAKELKVEAVLTGRVTQRGDGLSISVELINTQDNAQIWGQQYNRKLADVFAVQQEIAQEISEKLRLKLTTTEQRQLAKRPTENLKAFQYYIQGRTYTQRRTREDLLEAIRYQEKALAEDSSYALAYAGLTDAYTNLGLRGYISPAEAHRKAEEYARKALELDENLAEAHAALGQTYVTFTPYTFAQGDRELRRAIELSPSSASSHFILGNSLLRQGRIDEASAEVLKAGELDPLSSIIARSVAGISYYKRDYARALELLRKANKLGPSLSSAGEIGMYIQNRAFDEAWAELEKAKQDRPNDTLLIADTGILYAAQGRREEALKIIKKLGEMSGANLDQAHWIAKIYATLNEKQQALEWLDRGLAAGAIGGFIKDDPLWDPIRSDPRFADLVRRMGIPQ